MKERQRKRLYQSATRAAMLGLAVNVLLGAVKLTGGLVSGSFALISDAINSLGDSFTSVVTVFGLKIAQKPPDAEHPYGHTRAEAIAATNVALLVVVSALFVGWEALRQLGEQHSIPPIWTLWIAGGNVVIKEGLYRYKLRVGRETGSMAVIANAWDHRADALCSLAVLTGLSLVRWESVAWGWADEAAALVVVTGILWSGTLLFRRSASDLLDRQAGDELLQRIRSLAFSVADVEDVETLWVRKSGLEYFADIHIEVDPDLTVSEGHRIGHEVKDRLLTEIPVLRDVLVHLEPTSETGDRVPDDSSATPDFCR